MNIFALDINPTTCAAYHVDRHVVKMILEYSQLLSTAHRILDGVQHKFLSQSGRSATAWKLADEREGKLYKATHVNHPSAIWARESSDNYIWLQNLLVAVCKEYTYRYGKIHKCESSGLVEMLWKMPNNIKSATMTDFRLAMPDDYKVNNTVESYRNYYRQGKQHLMSWKRRSIPEWVNKQ